jgi:hypothetical protein
MGAPVQLLNQGRSWCREGESNPHGPNGVALARPVGEELRSGFVYAILLKSVIHRHNLDPNLRK